MCRPRLTFFYCLLLGTLFLQACKKNPLTKQEMILGTWYQRQQGVDDNDNQTLDAEEVEDNTAPYVTLIVNKDGSGLLKVPTASGVEEFEFIWSFYDNERKLYIEYSGWSSDLSTIDELSSSKLVLNDDRNYGIYTR